MTKMKQPVETNKKKVKSSQWAFYPIEYRKSRKMILANNPGDVEGEEGGGGGDLENE